MSALTAELDGFVDPYDETLAAEAFRRYQSDLVTYNVTPALCRATCPALAASYPDGAW